jgi:hypothetical protein
MRSSLKALLITGSLAAASLGAVLLAAVATAAPAGAHPKPTPSPSPTPSSSPSPSPTPSSSAPTLITSNFACSNGVCEVGPGNVGMSFAAGMFGTGGPTCSPPGSVCNGNNFLMSVVSGSLPPGLQLDEQFNVNNWTIWGTPTRAGTYAFTVQVTPWNNNAGGIVGPPGTQQLTITIGTGNSDRPANMGIGWNGHLENLQVNGYDANIGALWSVSVTSTGRVVISNQPSRTTYPIDGFLIVAAHTGYPCPQLSGCDLTVTNNLGSSVTVHLGPPSY